MMQFIEWPDAVPPPEKGLLNVYCPSFGSISNVLKLGKKPTKQDETFKKPEHPTVPPSHLVLVLTTSPLFFSFGLKKVFSGTSNILPFFLTLTIKSYSTPGTGQKKLISNHLQYSEEHKWTQYQPSQFLVSRAAFTWKVQGKDMQPACTT